MADKLEVTINVIIHTTEDISKFLKSFKDTILPSGFGAENSGAIESISTGAVTATGFDSASKFFLIFFPCLVSFTDLSKPL